MKEGWTYRKLSDVCSQITDGSHFSPKEDKNGRYPMLSVKDMDACGFNYNSCKFINEDDYQYLVANGCKPSKNDVLVAKDGSYLKTAFVQVEDIEQAILSSIAILKPKTNILSPFFLTYFFKAPHTKEVVEKHYLTGTAIKRVILKGFKALSIPVPSLEEQERIVAELDLLTGIIDKQKAQLKELDTLARSIFYDMFGDPQTNEKGWPLFSISSICCELFAGGDKPKDCVGEKDSEYRYPVIGNGDGEKGIIGYSKYYRVGKRSVAIGARGASIGNCRVCEPCFTPVVRLITLVPNGNVNISYLFNLVTKLSFNVNGAGQAQLTIPNVANVQVPIPPIVLQESFAAKIEAIESQKQSITRSIANTQKLFDYTMDKYFG